MAIQGTLKTMSLVDLLQFVAAARKTGTLKFDLGKVSKQVYFQNGSIVGSKSNDPKEYLGQVLLHYGKVNEEQLQIAREAQRNTRAKLGEVLVQRGFMTEAEVLDILKTRTLEMIYELFLWEDGQFQFFDDEALPEDLTLIEVGPTTVIMEGIYRMDELSRYKTLVPSDRSILELAPGWTSSLKTSEEVRQILFFVEKRMSVAEICYHMHASPFHVYGQLFELVNKGYARVAGELPEPPTTNTNLEDLPETVTELIWSAQRRLDEDPETTIEILQRVLQDEPNNAEAQELLAKAEEKFIKHVFATELDATAIPKFVVDPSVLTDQQLDPQEGFLLSRINGSWDIQSILSICPFRDADCLRMIRKLIKRGIIGV